MQVFHILNLQKWSASPSSKYLWFLLQLYTLVCRRDCKLLEEFLWQKDNGMRSSHHLWFRTSPLRSKSVKSRTVPCLAGWWKPLGIILFVMPPNILEASSSLSTCDSLYMYVNVHRWTLCPQTIYKEEKEMPGAWQVGKVRGKTGILMLSGTISGFRLVFVGQIHREGRVNQVQLD